MPVLTIHRENGALPWVDCPKCDFPMWLCGDRVGWRWRCTSVQPQSRPCGKTIRVSKRELQKLRG